MLGQLEIRAIRYSKMHIPVLVEEVIEYLGVQPGENFIDGTCGAAGHTLAILEKNYPNGKVMCFDWDGESLERAKKIVADKDIKLLERAIFINDSYANLKKNVMESGFGPVSGILLDLGFSSDQLESSGRGFSFLKDEPLDMRYDQSSDLPAREIVNHWQKDEIEKIIKDYGEEPWARKISEAIVNFRKVKTILTTKELLNVIASVIPQKFQHARIHFATRTFQALRIAVNDELGNLQRFVPDAIDVLASGGRLAVISFHSLEDRIVKNFFREKAKIGQGKILTKKPIIAGEAETQINPRSRSAKLRVFKKA